MIRRALIAGSLALVAAQAAARPSMIMHADPRPILSPSIEDDNGMDLRLDDFLGRIVLVNIWATWCAACRAELETLDHLQQKLGGDAFHVLPLCVDGSDLPSVRRFYNALGLNNMAIYRSEDIAAVDAFGIEGVPTTILVDPQGRERGRVSGAADWNSRQIATRFQSKIAGGI
ncbi:TlpA family protein disulfide reductase [Roseovarius sp. MS2]|uniref:TlpA family protein disulfide reductase n=1 Tax=Roseovarius sp. MS2 TaxID=3390728 RepID=UPI003EDB7CE3